MPRYTRAQMCGGAVMALLVAAAVAWVCVEGSGEPARVDAPPTDTITVAACADTARAEQKKTNTKKRAKKTKRKKNKPLPPPRPIQAVPTEREME